MTEEVKPRGSPYGLAMALLQEHADALPGAVVIVPDRVLWLHDSSSLQSEEALQLLDEAGAVLGALAARHVPLALLLPSSGAAAVRACLAEANVLPQLKAVVPYQQHGGRMLPQQHDQPQQQQQQQSQQKQQQQPQCGGGAGGASSSSSSSSDAWMEAAGQVKAQTGVPWSSMLLFSPAGAPEVARLARRLGMAVAAVPAAAGLSVQDLAAGLEAYSSKLEGDRGY